VVIELSGLGCNILVESKCYRYYDGLVSEDSVCICVCMSVCVCVCIYIYIVDRVHALKFGVIDIKFCCFYK
jgi:hypothetical protein